MANAMTGKAKLRASLQEENDDGERLIRVRSLLDSPPGMIQLDANKGPRALAFGEEFDCPEHLLSERWMELVDESDQNNPHIWDKSRATKAAASKAVLRDVVAGIRRDAEVNKIAFGMSDEQVLKGIANERPAPMDHTIR